MEIIVCDNNLSERSLMIGYILKQASKKHLEIQINACKDWIRLAAALEGREWGIVIISLDGVRGLDITSNARPLSRGLIQISNPNFGVQACRIYVSYFFIRPVSCQEMQQALECALKGQGTT